VLVVDTSGVIVTWSHGAAELLGHDEMLAVGSTLDLIVPEEFRERHWAGFHRAIAAGKSWIDGAAAVLPVTCGDGQVRQFAGRLTFLRDPNNTVVGAVAVYAATSAVVEPLPVLGG